MHVSGDRRTADNFNAIRDAAAHLGLDAVACAHIEAGLHAGFHPEIREIAAPLSRAVSIGIGLSGPVLDTVLRAPTWTYYQHYRQVNTALDQAALLIAGEIRRRGFRAFPIPASQILDWDRLRGHLPHREIACLAGLGWHGRNNLLVTREHGSRIRLATVLTNMPLPPPRAADGGGCGSCTACIPACPVGAIHEEPARFNLDRCTAQLRRFSRSEKLGTMICGLCVRACAGTAEKGAAGVGTSRQDDRRGEAGRRE